MNRGEAITRLRDEVREPTPATWSVAHAQSLLDEAHTEVFHDLVRQNAPLFMTMIDDKTWPADQRETKMSAFFGRRVAQIRYLAYKATDAPASRTNSPYAIAPMQEAKDVGSSAPLSYWSSLIGADDPTATRMRMGYLATGNRLIIVPPPSVPLYLYAELVFLPHALDTDDQVLLDGEIPEWHYIVALKAAMNALVSTADMNAHAIASQRFGEAWQLMTDSLRKSMQTQENYAPEWSMTEP